MATDTKITAFNLDAGKTAERKMLSLWYEYEKPASGGTGTETAYDLVGYRIEDSSLEFNWSQDEERTDIIGSSFGSLGAPTITQNLSEWTIIGADKNNGGKLQLDIHNDLRYQQFGNLLNYKFIIVYHYAGESSALQAERFPACKVKVNSLGGSGDTNLDADISFGGDKEIGTAAISSGTLTFTKTDYPS